ncbi:4114_t:CDS:2, partial [Acaulospora colombiana]
EQEALQEAEEEERKKIASQEAQRRRAADRIRREQLRREEEEREQRAAEARRLAAQERRLEEARRSEERRRYEKTRQEERERQEEERKQLAASERETRIKEIQRRFEKLKLTSNVLLTGYVSVQAANTIVWRRRYFQLQTDSMLFFKNAEETHKVIESFELRGSVSGIKEWKDGYDDIRAIPHSFAVEFMDQPAWLFFADSEEDKDVLVSLILQLARL